MTEAGCWSSGTVNQGVEGSSGTGPGCSNPVPTQVEKWCLLMIEAVLCQLIWK